MRKLVNALMNDDYPQGAGTLNSQGKLCCLGVACEVAIQNGVEVEKINVDDKVCGCGIVHLGNEGRVSYDGETGTLPDSVSDWLGLEDVRDDGGIISPRRNPKLAGRTATFWNDIAEANFKTIGQLFNYEFLGDLI